MGKFHTSMAVVLSLVWVLLAQTLAWGKGDADEVSGLFERLSQETSRLTIGYSLQDDKRVILSGTFACESSRWCCRYTKFSTVAPNPYERYVYSTKDNSYLVTKSANGWSGTFDPKEAWDITFSPMPFGLSVWGNNPTDVWNASERRTIERIENGFRLSFSATLYGIPREVRLTLKALPKPHIEECVVSDQTLVQRWTVVKTDPGATPCVLEAVQVLDWKSGNHEELRFVRTEPRDEDILWKHPLVDLQAQVVDSRTGVILRHGTQSPGSVTRARLLEFVQKVQEGRAGAPAAESVVGPGDVFHASCGQLAAFAYLLHAGAPTPLAEVQAAVPIDLDGLSTLESIASFLKIRTGQDLHARVAQWDDLFRLTRPFVCVHPRATGVNHISFVTPVGTAVRVWEPSERIFDIDQRFSQPPPDGVEFYVLTSEAASPLVSPRIWGGALLAVGAALLAAVAMYRRRRGQRSQEAVNVVPAAGMILLCAALAACERATRTRIVKESETTSETRFALIAPAQTLKEWRPTEIAKSCVCVETLDDRRGHVGDDGVIARFRLRNGDGHQLVWLKWLGADGTEQVERFDLDVAGKVRSTLRLDVSTVKLRPGESREIDVFIDNPASSVPSPRVTVIPSTSGVTAFVGPPRHPSATFPRWMSKLMVKAPLGDGPPREANSVVEVALGEREVDGRAIREAASVRVEVCR